MEKAEIFRKRTGTTDKGKEYENAVITKVILQLITDDTVKNFHLSSNDEQFGAFDDLVVKLESNKGIDVIAMQLKHSERKILSTEHLKSKKGDFSISKYFKCYQEIGSTTDEFILFTNRPFNCNDNVKFQLEEEAFYIQPIEAKGSLEVSEKANRVYQFHVVEDPSTTGNLPKIQEYKAFFEKFYLYTDQENFDSMRNSTMNKFRATYTSNEDIFDKVFKMISKWNMQEGSKAKLTKKWMRTVIALQLLCSHIEPLSLGSVNERTKIFREVIAQFDITLFGEKSCETVKQMWGDSREDKIDVTELTRVGRNYQLATSCIDGNNLNVMAFSQILWIMDKCPLIVHEFEGFETVMQLCPEKKFILVGADKKKGWMTNYSVFRNLSDLSQKRDMRERVMHSFTISIQKKKELDLLSAFGNDEPFLEIITTDNLVEMLNGPCNIGGEKETLPEPYIERYLSRNIISIAYLEKVQENTTLVLNCANNLDKVKDKLSKYKLIDIDNFLQKKNQNFENLTNNELHKFIFNRSKHKDTFNLDKSTFVNTIYVGNRNYTDSELQQICSENTEIKTIHYFKLLNDGNLEWIKSRGDVSDLESYKFSGKYFINEHALWSSRLDNNINLITGDPGMGKSELMKSFKNKAPREYWTVIIHPKEVNSFFNHSKFSETDLFETFIMKEKNRSFKTLDQSFFEMCVKKNRVIYVWDALDEILSENLDAVSKIIFHLSKKGCLQWITSRTHLRTFLEKKISLLSLAINQFSEQEQQDYIRKRLTFSVSGDEIEVTVEKIKSSFAVVQHVDILGIPLQIFMTTELFRQNKDKYLRLMENSFLLTDLYEYFIEEKFNSFYKDKMGFDVQNPHMESIIREKKRKALAHYESIAFKVVFPGEILQRLNIDCEKHMEKVLQRYSSLGLVKDFQNSVPRFLHGSFAEYLVATYFSKHFDNIKNTLVDVIFDAKYNNVRFFFDVLMAENSKVHIAVLYKNYELLQTFDDEILTRKDNGGRSVLHLISSWGQRHPQVKITGVPGQYIVHENNSFSKKAEKEAYFKTVRYLQSKNDVDENDVLLGATPLSYARKSESLGAELKLLQTINSALNRSCTCNEIINLLYYSSLLGYDEVCKLFTVQELSNLWHQVKFTTAETAKTPLLLASESGHLTIVKYLLKSGVEIDCVSKSGKTPLYAASLNGYGKIVESLVKAGTQINRDCKEGVTPLHVASFNGHEETVICLAKGGADINRPDNLGGTPLHAASFKGQAKTVQSLLNIGAKINCTDSEGWTPLHIASFNGHGKTLECLVKNGAEIGLVCNKGETPLHVASQNGQEQVIVYLVKVGAQINRGNYDGATPLYVASQSGHENIVEILVTAGAEINCPDNLGWIPLHAACEYGYGKIVKYLVENGTKINWSNLENVTPLHVASQNGHEEIVQYLVKVGAEINCLSRKSETPLHLATRNGHEKTVQYLVKAGSEIDRAYGDGWTSLHLASQYGYEKIISYLLEAGAEINRGNKEGATPLHVACHRGHGKAVTHLVKAGADINCAEAMGWTPFHIAAKYGHDEIVKDLAKAGADINRFNKRGQTPLHSASRHGHQNIVKFLVKVGVDVNCSDNDGSTPLSATCQKGHEETVQFLVKAGAEINRFDNMGWVPLHTAVECGHEKTVECLVKAGAEINPVSNEGLTPLHAACRKGHEKIVEYLLKVGAETNRGNDDGWTPLHMASAHGHDAIIECLIKAGAEINRTNRESMTSLDVAFRTGQETTVQYLVTHGGKINSAKQKRGTPFYDVSKRENRNQSASKRFNCSVM
ncbi:uncharacterized protein LOC135123654 [Zophobas morio]|uniref:uncharacterized protein LOC135123654 n=1 Tax=Zophobas morio TaxID=2755281 RepID=UPI0030828564